MLFASLLLIGIGLGTGFLVGKHLLTPLILSLAHYLDKASGFEISMFFRKLFTSANESEFILDGDPLKLPVTILCVGLSMWICSSLLYKIGTAPTESVDTEDEDNDTE